MLLSNLLTMNLMNFIPEVTVRAKLNIYVFIRR